jgi:two-component system LytT family response regulator
MKILIVDDELLARRLVREFLSRHTDVQIIGECENGLEAVDFILDKTPDLVFLDIQMPKLSGLEVLEVTGRKSGVIFTTAFDEYALRAFDLHAVDYLLKPFSQARFDDAMTRAKQSAGQVSTNLSTLISQAQLERIVVRDRGMTHFIPVNTVDFIEAQDDYIMIHSLGKAVLKTQTLSEIETQLNPTQFIRIHRSYLLNIASLNRIERLNKDSLNAVLKNGVQLPISRKGYERIRPFLQD